MFISAFVLALPLFAAASPHFGRRSNSTQPCSTGDIQCCDSKDLVEPNSNVGSTLLTLAGLDEHPDAYYGSVAASCNTGVGVLNGGECSGTTVCCSTTGYALVSIGCVIITL